MIFTSHALGEREKFIEAGSIGAGTLHLQANIQINISMNRNAFFFITIEAKSECIGFVGTGNAKTS